MLNYYIKSKLFEFIHKETIHLIRAFTSFWSSYSFTSFSCTGFNADFDGDQMAVHLPLYEASQLEHVQ
jgi:DNA-directed RNA polymerase beta' subunit